MILDNTLLTLFVKFVSKTTLFGNKNVALKDVKAFPGRTLGKLNCKTPFTACRLKLRGKLLSDKKCFIAEWKALKAKKRCRKQGENEIHRKNRRYAYDMEIFPFYVCVT